MLVFFLGACDHRVVHIEDAATLPPDLALSTDVKHASPDIGGLDAVDTTCAIDPIAYLDPLRYAIAVNAPGFAGGTAKVVIADIAEFPPQPIPPSGVVRFAGQWYVGSPPQSRQMKIVAEVARSSTTAMCTREEPVNPPPQLKCILQQPSPTPTETATGLVLHAGRVTFRVETSGTIVVFVGTKSLVSPPVVAPVKGSATFVVDAQPGDLVVWGRCASDRDAQWAGTDWGRYHVVP